MLYTLSETCGKKQPHKFHAPYALSWIYIYQQHSFVFKSQECMKAETLNDIYMFDAKKSQKIERYITYNELLSDHFVVVNCK